MCSKPLLLPANNKGLPLSLLSKFPSVYNDGLRYIQVPCGVCPECLYRKQMYLVQRVEMLVQDYDMFYGTFTYSPEYLPSVKIGDFTHHYTDIKHLQFLVRRIRDNDLFGKPIKYLAVTEYGGKRHRPHAHVLFFRPKDTDIKDNTFEYRCRMDKLAASIKWDVFKYWSYNSGTRKHPVYKPLCRYVERGRKHNYEFRYVPAYDENLTPQNIAFYLTKYVIKFDSWYQRKQQALRLNLSEEDYFYYNDLLRPRFLFSKHFGDSEESLNYIRSNLSKSYDINKPYFCYVSPVTGDKSPLAPFYRKKVLTMDDSEKMYRFRKDNNIDFNIYNRLDDTRNDIVKSKLDYDNRCSIIEMRNLFDEESILY